MPLLIDWFVQPLGLFFFALLMCLIMSLKAHGVSGLQSILLFGSALFLWVCSAPLTSNALVKLMESPRYTVPAECNSTDGAGHMTAHSVIVVLGADLDAYVDSDNPYRVLSRDSLIRTMHAASLDSGNSQFYVMGGGQTYRKLGNFMAPVLIDQGVPDANIVRDLLSQSTQTNAEHLLELRSSVVSTPITLVTSSLHMNRAVDIFGDEGFNVCPSASSSLYSVSAGWVGLLPYIAGLNKTTLAFRELLATLKYRLLR